MTSTNPSRSAEVCPKCGAIRGQPTPTGRNDDDAGCNRHSPMEPWQSAASRSIEIPHEAVTAAAVALGAKIHWLNDPGARQRARSCRVARRRG